MGRKSVKKHEVEEIVYENGFKYVVIDGLKYTNGGSRLTYTPEFHDNHGKPWSEEDKAYLIQMRVKANKGYADISAALGRTYGTCADKYFYIKKHQPHKFKKYLEMEI